MTEPLDMSEFEAQFNEGDRFSEFMSNTDFERLSFLKERIRDISESMAFRDDQRDSARSRIEEVQQLLREFERIMANLRRIRDPLQMELTRLLALDRSEHVKKSAYERELARLEAEIESRRRFILERNEIEEISRQFPWRVGVDGKKALPHQIDGAHRLVSAKRGILGDKPGLGKTLQAIMAIDLLRVKGSGKKVLIFTPKSVLRDFERAFERWTNPTFVHVLNQTLKGIKTEILEAITHFPEAIVITNYEVWRKDISVKEKFKQCGFDTVILDEAHVLKGAKSLTTLGIREIIYAQNRCSECNSMDIRAKRTTAGPFSSDMMCGNCGHSQKEFGEFCSVKNAFFMTGTPILNKPQELWPPLNMIDRESFPSEKAFLEDYCEKTYDYQNDKWVWTFGSGGSERLLGKLGMRYTARTRESANVVMPPQEVKHHWLELDPEKYPKQHKFVTDLREKARLAFSETEQLTTDAVLAWYTRMRQAASWPDAIEIKGCPHDPPCTILDEDGIETLVCSNPEIVFPKPGTPPIGESVIMDEAETIVKEAVEDGDRIVVFSMFKKVIAELYKRCEMAGLRVGVITGDVSQSKRQIYIDDFNTNHTKVGEHQYDVLICQYATAQVGLNLNGAQQLLCIEREWNPGKEEQTLDRVRRIDSEFNSIVHILHCSGTATDLIDALQEQKKAMLEGFESEVNLQEAMRKFLED